MGFKCADINLLTFLGNCDHELVSGRIYSIPDGQISASSEFDEMSMAKYSRFHISSNSDGQRYVSSSFNFIDYSVLLYLRRN